MQGAKLVYVLEENIKQGGVAEKIAMGLSFRAKNALVFGRAIEQYIQHGGVSELMQECGFNATQVAMEVEKLMSELDG